MNRLWSLIKISLNVNFGISARRYELKNDKGRRTEIIATIIALIVGVGSLVFGYAYLLNILFDKGRTINQPEIILGMAFLGAQMIIMFMGIFYILSYFYFANDLNILIPLPLTQWEVLISKFIVIMVNEYLILIPFMLPPLLIYGIKMGMGFIYWLKSIILILMTPVMPLAISSLLVIILMRFINLRRHKDALTVIGSILVILIAISINYFGQTIPPGSEQEFLDRFITTQYGIINSMGKSFPPSLWAVYSITQTGIDSLLYLFLFTGLSIALLALLIWTANIVFYKGVLAGTEVSHANKKTSKEDIYSRKYRAKNPVWAIFGREWRIFLRTPIYSTNGLLPMIIAPFILAMPFFTQTKDLDELYNLIDSPLAGPYMVLIILGFNLFISGTNMAACTSISREGNTFWISKIIPISPREQVIGKIIHSMSISGIGIGINTILFSIILGINIWRIAIIVMFSLLGALFINILNLMIDINRPKLHWTNPQEAVKSNLNGLFGIISTIVIIGIISIILLFLLKLGTKEGLVYFILTLIMIIALIPSLLSLFKMAGDGYNKIEI